MEEKPIDELAGKKFNMLTVRYIDHINSHSTKYYFCECECGNTKVVERGHLLSGSTKSCGHYRDGWRKTCHNMTGSRFHNIWRSMNQRCLSHSCRAYKYYGGRGIKICDRWLTFNNFYADMYKSYVKHIEEFGEGDTSIDRIDVNGNYGPSNCHWATRKEQSVNKRTTILIYDEVLGMNNSLLGYCETHNLIYGTVRDRYRHGWKLEDAVKI